MSQTNENAEQNEQTEQAEKDMEEIDELIDEAREGLDDVKRPDPEDTFVDDGGEIPSEGSENPPG